MQLNSLSLNSNTTSANSKSFLGIYDHNLVIVNKQIFVFGKTFSNFSIQTPLHKINIDTLEVEPVYTTNAPIFQQFLMFSFQKRIYFFGKKLESQNDQLYQFDGCKFNKLDQTGSIPYLSTSYSYTIFSHQYLLLFLCLTQNSVQNKWYIFDIKKRQWKQINCEVQIPICQKSSILWKNGRGYLLLQSAYLPNKKTYRRNILYQIKYQNFKYSQIKCEQIELISQIESQNIIFSEIFAFDEKYLMILGGQQNQLIFTEKQHKNEDDKEQKIEEIKQTGDQHKCYEQTTKDNFTFQKNFNRKQIIIQNKKIVYKFDLELFQWSNQFCLLNVKGQNHKIVTYNYRIFLIGGNYQGKLSEDIQFHDFNASKNNTDFPYEQTLCYHCESAFTYDQKVMYEPIIQNQYQSFSTRNVIQNKFYKKMSQSITNQIQAIGMVIEFLIKNFSNQIKLNLCEEIKNSTLIKNYKRRIQWSNDQILEIKGTSSNLFKKQILLDSFSDKLNKKQVQFDMEIQIDLQSFNFNFLKLKIACFKLGVSFLYVTITQEKQIFVGYYSYSETNIPETECDSTGPIYYFIKYDNKKFKNNYSSIINRHIIFQNVKLYFGNPGIYQNSVFHEQKNPKSYYTSIYIMQVNSLQKSFNIQIDKNRYFQDIRLKQLIHPKSNINPTNSLINYLKHLFIQGESNSRTLDIFVQNQQIQIVNIYQKMYQLQKKSEVKLIFTTQQNSLVHKAMKNQLQQTHFSENQDELYLQNQRKLDLVQKCALYHSLSSKHNKMNTLNNLYTKKIFIYKDKKLLKTISSKKQLVCGIIEIIPSMEILLNQTKFFHKKDQRKLFSWINQIQSLIRDDFIPSNQDI